MNASENALTEKEKSDGWEILFDGKTINGWHSYGKDKAGIDWKVIDGAIMLEPVKEGQKKDGGDIVTDKDRNLAKKIDGFV